MGIRKKNFANNIKEIKKVTSFSILNNLGFPPRKVRLLTDLIKGKDVNYALSILKNSSYISALYLEKLLLSTISNWQIKNVDKKIDNNILYLKEIYVLESRRSKRIRTAPQGRVNRIKKRSSSVKIVIDCK